MPNDENSIQNEDVRGQVFEEQDPEGQVDANELVDGEGSTEPSAEEEIFQIRYPTPEGEDVVEYTAEELSQLVAQVKTSGGKDAESQQLLGFLNQIKDNDVFQEVSHYIREGTHTPDQIRKGLAQLWASKNPDQEEAPPEFETVEDQIKYYVKQEVNKIVDPLKREQEVILHERKVTATTKHNDNLIIKALGNIGKSLDGLTEEDYRRLGKSWSDMYPGISIDNYPMTAAQANILIKDALLRQDANLKKRVSTRTTASDVQRQSNAPKVVISKSVTGREALPLKFQPTYNTSDEQMQNNFLKTFGVNRE